MTFYEELKRRNVVKVAVLYGIGSWVILQIADVLFLNLGVPEWSFSLVLGILILFFIPALVMSWVYEITPEGIKREKDIDRSQSITPTTGRKIDFLIIALLVVAIGTVAVDRLFPESGPIIGTESEPVADQGASETTGDAGDSSGFAAAAPELSIAVLPFADMSPNQDQEYFTDGISEELLNLLARVPDFRVAGRTSSFAFKGKNEDLRVIGQKLGVAAILEGSVRKDGDQIRITAQLVKTDDGYHVWSDTYDRKLENIFALQDDIAQQVVAALKTTLLGDTAAAGAGADPITRSRPTGNAEAYASYLRARHFQNKWSFDGMNNALVEFQKAITLDPDFAEAHAGLAITYWMMGEEGYRNNDDIRPLAFAAIEEALNLDPGLSEGLLAKALFSARTAGQNNDDIVATLQDAIEANPNNSRALAYLSNFYYYLDRTEDADRLRQRAYEVDPLSPLILGRIALNQKRLGNDAEAARYMNELADIDPNSPYLYRTRSQIATYDDDFIAATKWLHRAVTANPRDIGSRLDLASSLVSIGALDAAGQYVQEAYELSPTSPRIVARLADIMQYQGEKDAALAMLEKELEEHPTDIFLKFYQVTVLFHMERYDDARDQLVTLVPGYMSDPPRFGGGATYYAPRMIWMLRRDGNEAQAKAIYDDFYDGIRTNQSYALFGGLSFMKARYEVGMGNKEAMLENLAIVAESSNGSWDAFQDPMFKAFANDADYAAMLARFEAIQAERREALVKEGVL